MFNGGYLKVQSGFLKIWKRSCFRIEDGTMREFTTENGKEVGCFDINICEPNFCSELASENAFSMKKDNRIILFKAESQEEYQRWKELFFDVLNQKSISSLNKKKVSLDDFVLISVIGRGTFGKVSLVKYIENDQLYALKSMRKTKLAKVNYIQQILNEREILLKNQHPFLVAAHFTFQTETKLFIVLDYVPGGELLKRLNVEGRFSEKRTQLYAAEILLGIEHLHKHGIIYRDLKPENILVDEYGHLKITDFGFAKNIENEETTTFCGTPEYLAPEVIRKKAYTKSVDWWAFGIIVYEMLCGCSPFSSSNRKELMESILFDPISFPSYLSPIAIDLINKLLDRNKKTRLGSGPQDASEIKDHPFFKNVDWDAVLNKRTRPEWIPKIQDPIDVSNFDSEFTEELPGISFEDPILVPKIAQDAFKNFTFDDCECQVIEA